MIAPMNWKPTNKQLREFGVVILVGFGLLGWGLWHKGHAAGAQWCWTGAGVVGTLALVAPPIAKPFYWLWMGLGFAIGQVTSRIVMAVLFFGLLTPVAIFFRRTGRDALRRSKPETKTYWLDHPDTSDKKSYEHLF